MERKRGKKSVTTKLHPDGLGDLPGPVVEVEFPSQINTDHPIGLDVGRKGDAVLLSFQVGDAAPLVLGVPWPTAQQWAEKVLAQVAAVRGVEAFFFTIGPVRTTVLPAKEQADE